LSREECAVTEALVAHMWPADHLGASGVDLGIAHFIDRQLAGAFGRGDRLYLNAPFRKGKPEHGYQLAFTPEGWYKAGIAALTRHCMDAHGKPFDQLSAQEREAVLIQASTGKATSGLDLAAWFNGLFYPLFVQGAFSDPIYGGNRGKAAWKMIGYPGLPAFYSRDIVNFRASAIRNRDTPMSIQDFPRPWSRSKNVKS